MRKILITTFWLPSSTTLVPPIPISSAICSTEMFGSSCSLRDNLSQFELSLPAMWVTSLTSRSVATHRSVHTIDALLTIDPLGLSVIAHVKAVILSPLRAMLRPERLFITVCRTLPVRTAQLRS
jgi:hypothetical protein